MQRELIVLRCLTYFARIDDAWHASKLRHISLCCKKHLAEAESVRGNLEVGRYLLKPQHAL
jgi:hypothetical protein